MRKTFLAAGFSFVFGLLSLILSAHSVSAVTAGDITTGLIGSWSFDEGAGSSVSDGSGLGHPMNLLSGAGWRAGVSGASSIGFNGVSGYAQTSVGHIAGNLAAFSVSFWFKADVLATTTNRGLVCVQPNGSVRSTFCTTIQRSGVGSKIGFYVASASGTTTTALSNAALSSTGWNHVVGIYDGSKLQMYLNGVLQQNQPPFSGMTSDPGQPIRLNYSNAYGELGTFGGAIDELKIYSRALASDDVSLLYSLANSTSSDVTPPVVSMTAPQNGAIVSGTTTVSADATDAGGVAGVSFFADGKLISAEDVSYPYSTVWDASLATVGTHTLFAVARDLTGNVATSSFVTVTRAATSSPDSVPPVVSINSPSVGSVVSGATTVSADAIDNVGVSDVRFFVDGSLVGSTITTAPYQLVWDTTAAANASHSIIAVARDAAGNIATSSSVAVTVSNSTSGLETGLTLHNTFEERSSTSTIADTSSKHTPGVFTGSPAWVKGKFGSGIFFAGSGQYVTFPSSRAGSNASALTVSVWFKPTAATSTMHRGLVCVPANGPIKSSFCLAIQRTGSNSKLSFGVSTSANTYVTVYSDKVFASTDWNHVVGIYDGSKLQMYLNGVLQQTEPALTGTVTKTDQPVMLNYSNSYGDRGTFAGIMDDVRVYERAISPAEVSSLYNLPDLETPFEEDVPDIWISEPGATNVVAGTTTPVSAQVDDADPMMSMQFYLDGVPLGPVDAYAPFSIVWDTMKSSNGIHTLTATGVTPGGSIVSAPPVTIEVKNIPDTVPPSVPAQIRLTPVGPSQINIAWTRSTDNVLVKNYDVYRCAGQSCTPNTYVGTKPATFIVDSGLAASTTYSYLVVARDVAGNVSASSTIATAATLASLPSCSASSGFSFGVFSDTYSGQESGLRSTLAAMLAIDPNLRFVTSGGDTPSYQRVRGLVDEINGKGTCAGNKFAWFPGVGNHDAEDAAYMAWWANTWTGDWTNAPQNSPLATQLPGVSNFRRGPLAVLTPTTTAAIQPGTIYSFDYKNAHFLFLDTYEQGISDKVAGVWDINGSSVSDPTNSQLDWINQDLASTSRPLKFAFAHNALVTPIYTWDKVPPGWSEHNSSFHMDDLVSALSANNATAYFFGHDHVASRELIDGSRNALFKRLYWDSALDLSRPFGDSSPWSSLIGSGKVWEMDAGRVYDENSFFTIVRVNDASVTFEIYAMPVSDKATAYLWDTYTIPVN